MYSADHKQVILMDVWDAYDVGKENIEVLDTLQQSAVQFKEIEL